MLNDCMPIVGYRRKPYMVIGWSICSFMLALIWLTPLPEPYRCRDNLQCVCNAHAASKGGKFAFLMMGAAMGYVVADVAADGLTVEYARREPQESRGHTQASVRAASAPTQRTTHRDTLVHSNIAAVHTTRRPLCTSCANAASLRRSYWWG
jgi:hypothetical protein